MENREINIWSELEEKVEEAESKHDLRESLNSFGGRGGKRRRSK